MSPLTWLQEWYYSQCDGDWEHCYGVKIYASDNPGWCVNIDMLGTSVEGKEFFVPIALFELLQQLFYLHTTSTAY